MNYSQIAELKLEALENVTGGHFRDEDFHRSLDLIRTVYKQDREAGMRLRRLFDEMQSEGYLYTYDDFAYRVKCSMAYYCYD